MIWFCFFEQSGTFKNEFKKLGYTAYDFDIENRFGETDFVIDLFTRLADGRDIFYEELTYLAKGEPFSIMAFFPCVRFEAQSIMHVHCTCSQVMNKSEREKYFYHRSFMDEVFDFYHHFLDLVEFAQEYGIPLVIENPWSPQSFLIRYFYIKPAYIDYNRRENGDFFKKPTAYWFINLQRKENLVFDGAIDYHPVNYKSIGPGIKRSLISSNYAERFIKSFLI